MKAIPPGIGIHRLKSRKVRLICAQVIALTLAGCASLDRTAPPLGELTLSQARVVYVAESHDDDAHHRLQESIIQSLHRRGKPIAVGMEMIEVTQQPALDDYLQRKITWSEFTRRTGFDRGWGRTSPAYQRILAWCRQHCVPVVGLNAPRSVTRKISEGRKLTPAEAALIPNFPEPPGGFGKFRAAMAGHPGSARSLRRYYKAQCAWDKTMAGRILAWQRDHPGTMVVLLGQFHADPQTGVPWYVADAAKIAQVIILPRKNDRNESPPVSDSVHFAGERLSKLIPKRSLRLSFRRNSPTVKGHLAPKARLHLQPGASAPGKLIGLASRCKRDSAGALLAEGLKRASALGLVTCLIPRALP